MDLIVVLMDMGILKSPCCDYWAAS
jgi:hypothetical protein